MGVPNMMRPIPRAPDTIVEIGIISFLSFASISIKSRKQRSLNSGHVPTASWKFFVDIRHPFSLLSACPRALQTLLHIIQRPLRTAEDRKRYEALSSGSGIYPFSMGHNCIRVVHYLRKACLQTVKRPN